MAKMRCIFDSVDFGPISYGDSQDGVTFAFHSYAPSPAGSHSLVLEPIEGETPFYLQAGGLDEAQILNTSLFGWQWQYNHSAVLTSPFSISFSTDYPAVEGIGVNCGVVRLGEPEPECNNTPDGQAYLSVIATDVEGNKIAEKYPFDFTQGFHTFDVSSMFSSPLETLLLGGSSGISMVGYIVNAPKGFTSGNIEINELYNTVQGGFFEHSGGKFEISLQEGSNKGQIISPHWLVSLYGDAGYPIPVMFSGQVTLNCNFAPLPDCMPDSGDTVTTDEYIAEQPIAYPPLGPDPVPPGPIEPVEPISPIEPVEPIVEPLPPDIVLPPQPVEPSSGCECEIYVGKQISRVAKAVASTGTALQDVLTNILGTLKTIQKTQQQSNDLLAEGVDKLNESLENLTDDLMDEMRYDFEALDFTLGDIKDCLRLDPCEPEYPDGQTISEVFKEFVEQYEPPLVEVQEGLVAVNQDSDRVYRSNFK